MLTIEKTEQTQAAPATRMEKRERLKAQADRFSAWRASETVRERHGLTTQAPAETQQDNEE